MLFMYHREDSVFSNINEELQLYSYLIIMEVFLGLGIAARHTE